MNRSLNPRRETILLPTDQKYSSALFGGKDIARSEARWLDGAPIVPKPCAGSWGRLPGEP